MDEILKFFQDNKMSCDLHLLKKGTYSITVYGWGQFPRTQEFSTLDVLVSTISHDIDNYLAQ